MTEGTSNSISNPHDYYEIIDLDCDGDFERVRYTDDAEDADSIATRTTSAASVVFRVSVDGNNEILTLQATYGHHPAAMTYLANTPSHRSLPTPAKFPWTEGCPPEEWRDWRLIWVTVEITELERMLLRDSKRKTIARRVWFEGSAWYWSEGYLPIFTNPRSRSIRASP